MFKLLGTKSQLILFLSVTLMAQTGATAADSKKQSQKKKQEGYYGSIKYPDMGTDTDKHFQPGEGYYGSLSRPDLVPGERENAEPDQASDQSAAAPPDGSAASKTTDGNTASKPTDSNAASKPAVDSTNPGGESAQAGAVVTTGSADAKGTTATPSTKNASTESNSSSIATDGQVQSSPPSSSDRKIDELEKHYFQTCHSEEAQLSRLARLESLVFGQILSGTVEERVNRLDSQLHQPAQTALEPGSKAKLPLKAISASTAFGQGISYYNQHAYHAAEASFEQACEAAPNNPQYHYWLGLVRQAQRDNEGAHQEFEIAFRLNPFGDLAPACKKAMLQTTESETIATRPPVDSPQLTEQSLRIIRRQAGEAIRTRLINGQQTAAWRLQLGNIEAGRIDQVAQGYMRDAFMGRRGYYGNLGWNDMQEISNWRQIQMHYMLSDAVVQSRRAQQDGYERAAGIQASANGLYSQLADPIRPGEPRLRAFGTNLYVRYYGSEPSEGVQPPVVESPLRAVAMPRH